LIYSVTEAGRSETFLAAPEGGGRWRRRPLSKELPESLRGWSLVVPGGVTFTPAGRMVAAAMVQQVAPGETAWGHPTNEVVMLTSDDGGRTFALQMVSRPDRGQSHWLANIERATGHNGVPDNPGVIYTAGPAGEKNTEILANGVWWFRGQ
jgi:hypothetical protein